jgi:hypothetical protein
MRVGSRVCLPSMPADIWRRVAMHDVPPQVVGRATSAAVVNPISGSRSCVCAAITVNNTRIGDPGRNRTCDLQLRRLLLYPLSYGAAMYFPASHLSGERRGTIYRHHTTNGNPGREAGVSLEEAKFSAVAHMPPNLYDTTVRQTCSCTLLVRVCRPAPLARLKLSVTLPRSR